MLPIVASTSVSSHSCVGAATPCKARSMLKSTFLGAKAACPCLCACSAFGAAALSLLHRKNTSRGQRHFEPSVTLTAAASDSYIGRFDGTERLGQDESDEARASAGTRGRTAARWSILSERIEGLAKEMYMLVGSQDVYVRDHSTCEGPAMQSIREKMVSTDWAALWESQATMFSYGPEMSTDPVEAQFVKMLTYMKSPSKVLEIGMFTGYGSMAIAEALPADGVVVSLDIDPFLKMWVEEVTHKFPEGKKHEIIVGPAAESLLHMDSKHKFDMVFIDANKAEYRTYLETLLSRELLTKDAMIVADNTLYVGYPYLNENYDTQPKRRVYGDAIREFNQWVRDHPKLEQVILPIRDGVSMIRVRH
jgi:caffeoyl-CoA O-methyltransferase